MREKTKKKTCQLLVADQNGHIFAISGLDAAGMKGPRYYRLSPEDLIPLPSGSELFMLPDRLPVGFDPAQKSFIHLENNPFAMREEPCFAVAAFISPGYTATFTSAYKEIQKKDRLPLFAYAAVAYYKDSFYIAATCVDRERRQDLRYMDMPRIKRNVKRFQKLFPSNRLMRHLETCALCYGCPAAKNFFQQRYEAPLPTSPTCNARCEGCLSSQPEEKCSVTQPRITFVPSPEEIAEVALWHIQNVGDPVVSFGQGCEGEPLMVADTIERSIRLIRKQTCKGIINLNTNASKPDAIQKLFDAGLNSIRVSMNSVQEKYYTRYYKPVGYSFADVCHSVKIAQEKKGWVSVNYLSVPGFTDTKEEAAALKKFVRKYKINMIQWRNLNFDPAEYFRLMKIKREEPVLENMAAHIQNIHAQFPFLMKGYFNPSQKRIRQHRNKDGNS